ncbi:hypothetical protein [Modestobacter sp. Leaf380]|uniref:hypothetical protein n=1 Tax=Modestobacter sp. Leaf380 TaxID=1736356 RepID=UPI0006F48892|nr:hypothetical protein [Modestobacter sp. Leaf380]KQS68415.1 hypothetical protein ASG41_05335 [Modestobacter sp. Leaf380]
MHPHHRFPPDPFRRGPGGPGGRGGPFGGRGPGRGRGADAPPPLDRAEVAGWLAGRLPDDWFAGPVELQVDRDEITVVGTVPTPDAGEGDPAAAAAGRIARFREQTREQRMAIADAAQARYGRAVAWGAACGDTRELFTTLSVPVMTRLRQPERQVLDTLVDAGVARSRSEALAWSVKLVGEHVEDWLTELRTAMESVEEVRGRGPSVG